MDFLNRFWDSSPNGKQIILGGAAALMLCGCVLIAFSAWGLFFQGGAAAAPDDQPVLTLTPGGGGSGIPTATLAPTLPSATPTSLATATGGTATSSTPGTPDANAPCNCDAEEDAIRCSEVTVEQAQACLDYCGATRGSRRLDRNGDGIACNDE